jgi:hypothetical protein
LSGSFDKIEIIPPAAAVTKIVWFDFIFPTLSKAILAVTPLIFNDKYFGSEEGILINSCSLTI